MIFESLLDRIGARIAGRLVSETSGYEPYTPSDPQTLRACLRPGDVLLIEGNQKISTAIKYLTQSTWSHAALYVGDALIEPSQTDEPDRLVEVNLGEGCVSVPLSRYRTYNTRICRPVGLTDDDRHNVVRYMIDRIGLAYDLKNIIDLVRYLLPTPPVPVRWRRRMISLGSGDPTRAICSTLIAQAFQSVRYPILPSIEETDPAGAMPSAYSRREILHIRHHSLFAPRDFDLSPYFAVVKPTIEDGFDYRDLVWGETDIATTTEPAAVSDP